MTNRHLNIQKLEKYLEKVCHAELILLLPDYNMLASSHCKLLVRVMSVNIPCTLQL